MQRLIRRIDSNLHTIASLVEHPTRRLRVESAFDVLPALKHDDRPILAIRRAISGDGRKTVCATIAVTFMFVSDLVQDTQSAYTTVVQQRVNEISVRVGDGLDAIKKLYEDDVSVGIECVQLVKQWNAIIGQGRRALRDTKKK